MGKLLVRVIFLFVPLTALSYMQAPYPIVKGVGSVAVPLPVVLKNGDTMTGALGLNYTGVTANTVVYLDAAHRLISSSVTPVELGYLSGATQSIQATLAQVSVVASKTNALSFSTSATNYDVAFNVEEEDTHSAFNGTTFTAPVAGRYLVTTSISVTAGSGLLADANQYCEVAIVPSAGSGARARERVSVAGAVFNCSVSKVVPMTAGATLKVQALVGYSAAPTVPTLYSNGGEAQWNWVSIQRL